jgi:molybdopterin molybdotransferase
MALVPVEEALSRMLAGVETLAAETVPVTEAHGRVLAAALAALRDQPPRDVSAMDGYAAKSADLPGTLKVAGESGAGRPFTGELKAGEAARIFTGAVMPAGADTVVAQEDSKRAGERVTLPGAAPGKFIRKQGFDFMAGAALIPAGRRLGARDVGLAAAMGHAAVTVARRPRVALAATGDELLAPGDVGSPDRIVASNPLSLAAIARDEGADVTDLGILPDRIDEIVGAIRRARELSADVLVLIGGASVGDHDLVAPALAKEGVTPTFHRIALRPGRPLLFAQAGALRVLGVPGNPVSSIVCAYLFLVPLLRTLEGRSDALPAPEPAVLGTDLPANDARQDYLRARIERAPDGRLVATPFGRQDSALFALLTAADGLVIRPPFAPAARLGEIWQQPSARTRSVRRVSKAVVHAETEKVKLRGRVVDIDRIFLVAELAEVDIEILELRRPVRRERVFPAGAAGPARSLQRIAGHRVVEPHEEIAVRDSARDVEQGLSDHGPRTHARRREPIDLGDADAGAATVEILGAVRAADGGMGKIGLEAEHPCTAELPIVSNRAAAGPAFDVELFQRGPGIEMLGLAPAISCLPADVEAGPVEHPRRLRDCRLRGREREESSRHQKSFQRIPPPVAATDSTLDTWALLPSAGEQQCMALSPRALGV